MKATPPQTFAIDKKLNGDYNGWYGWLDSLTVFTCLKCENEELGSNFVKLDVLNP